MWILAAILHALYYISPAYCANAFAVFGFGSPVDGGRSWRGRRLLGNGKTWSGLAIGLAAGTFFGLMWFFLSQSGPLAETYYATFDFRMTDPLFGLYLAAGAMAGDLLGSFLKRRAGVPRGHPVWGLDQLDFVLGGLFFAMLFAPGFIILAELAALLAITPTFHLVGNQIAYLTRRKSVRW